MNVFQGVTEINENKQRNSTFMKGFAREEIR
jgi:hypothetical protein